MSGTYQAHGTYSRLPIKVCAQQIQIIHSTDGTKGLAYPKLHKTDFNNV